MTATTCSCSSSKSSNNSGSNSSGSNNSGSNNSDNSSTLSANKSTLLHTMSFEVFGKVQRVFMRKYTVQAAKRYQITGHVYNTESGTVKGEACGTLPSLANFKKWLSTKGSPKATIDRAVCTKPIQVDTDPHGGTFIKKKVLMSNGTQWATKKK
jgi:acylphosphatase